MFQARNYSSFESCSKQEATLVLKAVPSNKLFLVKSDLQSLKNFRDEKFSAKFHPFNQTDP